MFGKMAGLYATQGSYKLSYTHAAQGLYLLSLL